MYSIRNVAVLGMMLALGGCEAASQSYYEPAPTKPLVIDGAMQIRDWDRTSAVYQNGTVVAGPTLYPWRPDSTQNEAVQGALDLPLFLGQTLWLPVQVFVTPPNSEVAYPGVQYEPTYTAATESSPAPAVESTDATMTNP